MKKLLGLFLVLCMAVTYLSALAEPIEITVYHHMSIDNGRGQATQKILDQFNEKYAGVYYAVSSVNPDFPTYQEKVKAMIAANETPDIFTYNYNPNDLSRQKSGKLMDFMPYFDEEWKARFEPDDWQNVVMDGKLYDLPRAKQATVFYYNAELLAAAGYDHFPVTWDEFFECCEALKKNNVAAISLFTADDAWYTMNFLTYLFSSLAGSTVANSGNIDCEEMVKAAEYLQKAFTYTTNDSVGANYSVASNNFFTGKTAMVVDGPWLEGSIPDEMMSKIKIGKGPTFGDGKVSDTYLVTDALCPWSAAAQSDPAKAEAVITLLKYLTNEESCKIYALEGSEYQCGKMDLTADDIAKINNVQQEYYDIQSACEERIVNVQRNLTTPANAALPSLVEALVLNEISAQEFVSQLVAENES